MRERFIQVGGVLVVCFGLVLAGWLSRGAADRWWAQGYEPPTGQAAERSSATPPAESEEEPIDPENPPASAVLISNRPLHPNQARPKYHRLTCPHARRIKSAYRRYFRSAEEAGAAGFLPCSACNPDEPTSQPE